MTIVHPVCSAVSTFRFFSQLPRVPFVFLSPFSRLSHFHHRRMSSQRPLEPQIFPSTGFELIDPSVLLEEETIPNYMPQRFYPVRIGQIFNQQYQVVGKLGYGASSTVWLCRDLVGHDYVTLKIYTNSSRTQRELPIYKHLEKVQSNHAGRQCLRFLLDSFEVTGPDGVHICLIHQPLGMSLYELKMRARGKVFSKDVLRPAIRQLLAAVDYLHKEAHIIHTGRSLGSDETTSQLTALRSTTKQCSHGNR
ncbi:protein kinase [Histoplasma capsulatum var. duboisii H88]|uniref:non-specific serine/threonine protein kinase n=1 Tax=Ajellomyces capsulatus (strain H88) TaxID=544711 RepID=A0A8A1LT21_AJEC8|nr:protein kinase [Histoplasma capsulatum var. duboisii H88]